MTIPDPRVKPLFIGHIQARKRGLAICFNEVFEEERNQDITGQPRRASRHDHVAGGSLICPPWRPVRPAYIRNVTLSGFGS